MTNTAGKRRSNRLAIAAAVVGVVGLGGVAVLLMTPSRNAQQYMTDAQAYVAKGDLSSALIQLRNAVQREPGNANARYQLAVVSMRANDAVSAEKEIKVAQERGLSEDLVLPVLGAAYLEQGKFDVLLKSIPEGSRSAEVEGEVRVLRGMAQLGLRNIDAAEASFKSALAINPQKYRAEVGLARVDASRQEIKSADTRIDKVLSSNPTPELIAESLMLKGQVRRLDKDNEGAIAAYSKVIETNPGLVRARLERAQTNLELGNDDAALPDVNYVLQRAPSQPLAVNFRALIDIHKGNTDAAYDLLQRQGAQLNRFAPNLLLMARLQYDRNQLEAAQSNLQEFLQASPGNTDARLMLANLLLRKNLPDQAISILRATPADIEDVRVYRLLASASMRAGRTNDAGAWLDKAATVSNTPAARTQLAVERLSLGQTDAAIKDLDNAIEMDPNATDSRVLLVVTQLRQGKLDDAEAGAKKLQADLPDNPLPDNLLGGITLARGDRVAARQHFENAIKKSDFLPAMLNLAKLDVAEGKLDDAVKQYTAIVEQAPSNTEVMIALAELSLRRQQPAEAESWLAKAIAVKSDAVLPRVALINFHLNQKDFGKALASARELRQLAPSNSDAIDALGRVQLASGEATSAVDTYRSLVTLAPSVPLAHERLAQALFMARDIPGAKTALRNGMAANPDAASTAGELATLLQRTGEADEALTVARDWQRRHPDLASGDLLVGGILMLQNKPGDAAVSYTAAQRKTPSSQAITSLARARVAAGNADVATNELQSWLKQQPRDAAARELLATTLIARKQYDQATAESEELLKVQPTNPIVLNNLAWLYSQRGDSRAVEYAEKAHSLAPNAAAIMDTLGYILVRAGDTDRGVPLLRKAYDASQKHPEIGYHLAAGLAKAGQSSEARAVLETVMSDQRSFDEKADAKKLFDSLK